MRLAVFGACGRMGRQIVELALGNGYAVTALAEEPEKLDDGRPGLRVLEGDARDYGAVERTVNGADAVLCALDRHGPSAPSFMTAAARNVVMAMERSGVKRIVTLGRSGVLGDDGFIGALNRVFLHFCVLGHRGQFELLKASFLEWTVVRRVVLTGGTKKTAYRVSRKGKPPYGFFISRADAAHFMLKCAKQKKHIRSSPVVAY
jgi:uncharacterized protein YbjT (DUF2867 family)